MERLTSNKPTEEMNMVELAHNSCYTKDRLARYRDFDTDIDARDFARKLMAEFSLWKNNYEEMFSDYAFDDEMIENLMYEPYSATGLIALFYRNLWAMADLHARLKEYEDAEEQGLLLRLPHGIGKPCYVLEKCQCGLHYNCRLLKKATAKSKAIVIKKTENVRTYHLCMKIFERPFKVDYLKKIGKTVFLTKEEAEQALERMEKENE